MRYEFIKEHQDLYGIGLMCRLLKVSSSGYYSWRKRAVSQRKIANQKLFDHIYRVFHENRQVYGSVRVWEKLNQEGIQCGRDRVARLMKVNKLAPKRLFDKSEKGNLAPSKRYNCL